MFGKFAWDVQSSLTIVSCVWFLVVMFINFAASRPDLGIFIHPTGDVSDMNHTYITPAGWTFALWGIIYTWMAVALGYALSQLFRGNSSGAVYNSPATLPISFWLVFFVNTLLNVVWLFLWDREMLIACSVVLWLVALSNWLIMYLLHTTMRSERSSLVQLHGAGELRLLLICVINGLAIYATWTTIAALLNLNIALVHVGKLSNEVCSIVVGAVLGVLVLVYYLLEVFKLDQYTRWTISPWFTLLWATLGVMLGNRQLAPHNNQVINSLLLGEAALLLFARIIQLIYAHLRCSWSLDSRQVVQQKKNC